MTPCKDNTSWNSRRIVASELRTGVEFVIARMSFGRRLDLMRKVRDLASRLEFFEAGREARNEMEASLLGGEIDRLYVTWGLEEIRGLDIDGAPATPESLIDRGPEDLFREALDAVRSECSLGENERKN
jgi:hypothetical protein